MKIMVADAVVEDKGDDGQKCFLVAFPCWCYLKMVAKGDELMTVMIII